MRRLAVVAVVLFIVILAFLAGRVQAGADPAQPAAAATATPQPTVQDPYRDPYGSEPIPGGAAPDNGTQDPRPTTGRKAPHPTRASPLPRRRHEPPCPTGVMNRGELRFATMGSFAHVRLESPAHSEEALRGLAEGVRAAIEAAAAALTRFDPGSELSRLNADPREAVPVSPLLGRVVLAARWAGERSGGLVDATLLGELERAGYAASRDGLAPASLDDALAAAPPRRAARPGPRGYERLALGPGAVVRRPPGVRVDPGGVAKGLIADEAGLALPDGVRYAISCGGDLALGGDWLVDVVGAFTGVPVHRLRARGGVATSGIHQRLWPGGHHLLDPSTGEPAWTGLVAATAVGASALEAEVLAKAALLSGPAGARRLLRRHGGVLQHDDRRIEVIEPARVVRLPARRPTWSNAPPVEAA